VVLLGVIGLLARLERRRWRRAAVEGRKRFEHIRSNIDD
jgi:hypothetical protein